MGSYKRLGKNTMLVFIGTTGAKLMSLLMLPYYTKWLSVSEYGGADLITVYSTLLVGIISLTIYDAIFLFPKGETKNIQTQYFTSALAFAIISLIIFAVIIRFLSEVEQLTNWIGFIYDYRWEIYGMMASSYLQQLCQQFIRAIDKMLIYSTTGIAQCFSTIVFSFILIPKYGLNGYVYSIIAGNIIGTIYAIVFSKSYKYLNLREFNLQKLKEMLFYSIPLIPNGVMWFLINSFNRPLLETKWGLLAVGLMAIANKFPTLLNSIYAIFQQAFLISVVEELPKPSYPNFYNNMLKIVVVMQIFFALFLGYAGKVIIEIFTTTDYYEAWIYIPVLVIGVIFTNIGTFVGSNFSATRKSKYFFYSSIWAGLAAIFLNIILIPKLAIWGACLALVLSQAIGMTVRIYYSWNIVKITDSVFYIMNGITAIVGVVSAICLNGTIYFFLSLIIIMIIFYVSNRQYFSKLIKMVHQYIINRNAKQNR